MTPLPILLNLAFIGKAGSGKDTAAELLIEHFGYRRFAFADALKDTAASLWGEQARTNRDQLQRLGVAVREIEPDTWATILLNQLFEREALYGTHGTGRGGRLKSVVVTDCRFKNEAWALEGRGFVIVRIESERTRRISRLTTNGKLGPEGWEAHESETELDTWTADYTISNDATKVELLHELTKVIRDHQGAKVA